MRRGIVGLSRTKESDPIRSVRAVYIVIALRGGRLASVQVAVFGYILDVASGVELAALGGHAW